MTTAAPVALAELTYIPKDCSVNIKMLLFVNVKVNSKGF